MISLEYELILSAILFAIGMFGILRRKNAIVVLMSVEIVLNAAIMNFVAFSSYAHANGASGQVFALFAIAVAAAEAAIGLAMFIVFYRRFKTIDIDKGSMLRW
ncbi:MAG: NADH-quinone oxidoreductase subunit NuoK [Thermoplasmata archaeon]|nr:MAG: NADH-quinone oxidoreductase subunit NuoK [Methanomassiliicoccales archaeon]